MQSKKQVLITGALFIAVASIVLFAVWKYLWNPVQTDLKAYKEIYVEAVNPFAHSGSAYDAIKSVDPLTFSTAIRQLESLAAHVGEIQRTEEERNIEQSMKWYVERMKEFLAYSTAYSGDPEDAISRNALRQIDACFRRLVEGKTMMEPKSLFP